MATRSRRRTSNLVFCATDGPQQQRDKVREIEIVDPYRVRFHLHAPWPDFLTYYGTLATGAAWIVPKKYIEQVGDDAFKQRPVGLGPYKFVSQTPGIEIVMEANETYWRKVPHVKRLVFKSVPEPTTRLAMIKKGEVDLAYLLPVSFAEEVKRDPKLKLAFSGAIGIFWLDFLDQWDPEVRRGMTSGCGWPPTTPSIVRNSPRRKRSVPPSSRVVWSRVPSSLPCPSSPIPMIQPRRNSCWPRLAIPTASMPET